MKGKRPRGVPGLRCWRPGRGRDHTRMAFDPPACAGELAVALLGMAHRVSGSKNGSDSGRTPRLADRPVDVFNGGNHNTRSPRLSPRESGIAYSGNGETVTPGSYRGSCARWPAHGRPGWFRLPGRCPLAATIATSIRPARPEPLAELAAAGFRPTSPHRVDPAAGSPRTDSWLAERPRGRCSGLVLAGTVGERGLGRSTRERSVFHVVLRAHGKRTS
jgi:hypothetical protein